MSYPGLIAETVKYKMHNGDEGEAYFARPSAPGKHPGVVLIHHLPGWDEWITEAVRKLAHHGFATSPLTSISAKVRAAPMTWVRASAPPAAYPMNR